MVWKSSSGPDDQARGSERVKSFGELIAYRRKEYRVQCTATDCRNLGRVIVRRAERVPAIGTLV